jgi:poly(hydroxyalkanoate) granule-associated protein
MATRKSRPRKTSTSTASRRAAKTRVGRATAKAQAAQEQLRQGVQQVWLAGMGAFARAQKEGPAAFQEAVAEGLKLLGQSQSTARQRMRDVFETAQETLQSRVGGARNQAQETWDNLETLFQSRVQRAMHQLGVPTAEEIRILTRRVTELNESVRRIDAGGGRKGKGAKRRTATRGGKRAKRGKTAG